MTVRRLSLRISLPLGLALLLLVMMAVSLLNALDKRLAQLDQEARADLLSSTTQLARMAEQAGETSGHFGAELAHVASDPRVEAAMVLDDTGHVLAAHRNAWRGMQVTEVQPDFDMRRFRQVQQGRLPVLFSTRPDGAHIAGFDILSHAWNRGRDACDNLSIRPIPSIVSTAAYRYK